MMEFGKTLRAAREAKGYTVSQLAEATRLMSSVIEGFENENFSMIAAPIYGRGFVKLYCEAVDLDPKPFVAEFMEIYNGNRDLGIKERAVPQPPPPPPPPPAAEAPEAAQAPEQPDAEEPPPVDLFGAPAEPVRTAPPPPSVPEAASPLSAPRPKYAPDIDDAAPEEDSAKRLSRYAAPIREYKPRVSISLPPNFWRMALLSAIALAAIWGLCAGVKALYRATSYPAPARQAAPAERNEAPASAAAVAKPAEKPVEGLQPRKEIEVPPLYID